MWIFRMPTFAFFSLKLKKGDPKHKKGTRRGPNFPKRSPWGPGSPKGDPFVTVQPIQKKLSETVFFWNGGDLSQSKISFRKSWDFCWISFAKRGGVLPLPKGFYHKILICHQILIMLPGGENKYFHQSFSKYFFSHKKYFFISEFLQKGGGSSQIQNFC